VAYEARRGLGPANLTRKNAQMEELQDTQRIRELAARITTEAQFQSILDQVEPQAARDEVEKKIRPWLRFPAPAPEPVIAPLVYDDMGVVTDEQCDSLVPWDPKRLPE
jgi:hypothetical protein